jgi:hypothetical protein
MSILQVLVASIFMILNEEWSVSLSEDKGSKLLATLVSTCIKICMAMQTTKMVSLRCKLLP